MGSQTASDAQTLALSLFRPLPSWHQEGSGMDHEAHEATDWQPRRGLYSTFIDRQIRQTDGKLNVAHVSGHANFQEVILMVIMQRAGHILQYTNGVAGPVLKPMKQGLRQKLTGTVELREPALLMLMMLKFPVASECDQTCCVC